MAALPTLGDVFALSLFCLSDTVLQNEFNTHVLVKNGFPRTMPGDWVTSKV